LCEGLIEALGRCLPVQCFTGSGVEFGRGGGEIADGVYRQVGALGKVLAQQTVGVLVGAALPGVVVISLVIADSLSRDIADTELALDAMEHGAESGVDGSEAAGGVLQRSAGEGNGGTRRV
jgi:hypothetical protein